MSDDKTVACLCFSMDRALQLDGYLRSVKACMSVRVPVTVLYRTSSEFFEEGYRAVAKAHPDVDFLRETDFGEQVLGWADRVSTPLVMFGCDDVVYYRPVNLAKVGACLGLPQLFGVSLRLGRNIRYTHTRKLPVAQPALSEENDLLFWRWPEGTCDWGWAFELNGTVYPRYVIRMLLQHLEQSRQRGVSQDWRHPNKLEMAFNRLLRSIEGGPVLMASFLQSCLVVPTVNQVQTLGDNPLFGEARSVHELEALRRLGAGMDLEKYGEGTYERIHVGDWHMSNPGSPGTRPPGPAEGTP